MKKKVDERHAEFLPSNPLADLPIEDLPATDRVCNGAPGAGTALTPRAPPGGDSVRALPVEPRLGGTGANRAVLLHVGAH
jgi:hypothetical protein